MKGIFDLNGSSEKEAYAMLWRCCASENWTQKMLAQRPFEQESDLFQKAEQIWFALDQSDWLEAFEGHPQIGDLASLKKKFTPSKAWSQQEQSGISEASEQCLIALKHGNETYQQKFGYIFLVCATGKSAEEILNSLTRRLSNRPDDEIKVAASEQNKIIKLRLEKLL